MSIDLASSGLAMSLANKEALASRIYTRTCAVMQLLSSVTVLVALIHASTSKPDDNDCCSEAVWWLKISACQKPNAWFWTYFALRTLICSHSSWISWRLAPTLDKAEKDYRKKLADATYGKLYATATTLYLHTLPMAVVDIVSIEVMLFRLGLSRLDRFIDWGQCDTLVTCVAGMLHWIYVICRAVCPRSNGHPSAATGDDPGEPPDEPPSGPPDEPPTLRFTPGTLWERLWKPSKDQQIPTDRIRSNISVLKTPLLPTQSELGIMLGEAAHLGDMVSVEDLLRKGAPIDLPNNDSETPLTLAVQNGHEAVVNKLCQRGVHRALHVPMKAISTAVEQGNMKILRILMQGGLTKTDVWSKYGDTLLRTAIRSGQNASVENLLRLFQHDKNAFCFKPPMLLPSVVEAVKQQNRTGTEVTLKQLKSCFEPPQDARAVPEYRRCWKEVLQCAVERDNLDIVQLLLTADFEPADPRPLKFFPMHYAASKGRLQTLTILIEHALHSGRSIDDRNLYLRTALHEAVGAGQSDAVKLLLDRGAKTNVYDTYEFPLHTAIGKARPTRGKFSSAQDYRRFIGSNALNPKLAMVQSLLLAGADPNAWLDDVYGNDSIGRSPLARDTVARCPPLVLAAEVGSAISVKLLLDAGAKPGKVHSTPKRLPLHAAAEQGNSDVVELLLAAGADKRNLDPRQRSPQQIAQDAGHEHLDHLLAS